ncbi:MAG: hypothetical protein WC365_08085, partial [Candidatus Babeliales bacterium]
ASIFFWKTAEGTGDTVISAVTLELAFGVCGATLTEVIRHAFNGIARSAGTLKRIGSGTIDFSDGADVVNNLVAQTYAAANATDTQIGAVANGAIVAVSGETCVALSVSEATDLAYIENFGIFLKEN